MKKKKRIKADEKRMRTLNPPSLCIQEPPPVIHEQRVRAGLCECLHVTN